MKCRVIILLSATHVIEVLKVLHSLECECFDVHCDESNFNQGQEAFDVIITVYAPLEKQDAFKRSLEQVLGPAGEVTVFHTALAH